MVPKELLCRATATATLDGYRSHHGAAIAAGRLTMGLGRLGIMNVVSLGKEFGLRGRLLCMGWCAEGTGDEKKYSVKPGEFCLREQVRKGKFARKIKIEGACVQVEPLQS